jgi:Holliday junction resolvasome RuvABC endonuclease subunit
MKAILGFDASTTNVGWCLMDMRGNVLRSGCFSPDGQRAEDRLPLIAGWAVKHTMFDAADTIVFAIEEPRGHHANKNTDILLGRAYGILECVAYARDHGVIGINPQSVKRTGVHKHALPVASAMAGHECGEDEADAIGVALAALAVVREQELAKRGDA